MARLCLVSCVGEKLENPAMAQDLYVSSWFLKAKQYATRDFDSWFILSAKYGLVSPSDVVEPYEQSLTEMKKFDRQKWASLVVSQLLPVINEHDQLTILAGKYYREFLLPKLEKHVHSVHIPMARLTIGHQLRWLDEQAKS